MATAGTKTLGLSVSTLFSIPTDNAEGCRGFYVFNTSSSITVLVNVAGLHAAGSYFPVAPSTGQLFRTWNGQIKLVTAKGASTGSPIVNYGITETG